MSVIGAADFTLLLLISRLHLMFSILVVFGYDDFIPVSIQTSHCNLVNF